MPNQRTKRYLGLLVKLALVALAIGAVLYRTRLRPAPVTAGVVERGDIRAEVHGTGPLAARIQATVSSKIQGRLVEVAADQNERVRQGQLLARLDDRELRDQIEIAASELSAARAMLERVRADQGKAEAVLQQARRDFERMDSLVASDAISRSEHDKAKEKLQVAEADAARAGAAIQEAARQVQASEKALEYRRSLLAEARILAPFDGLIIDRAREAGDVVAPGGAIFRLIALDELWVSAWLDESALAGLREGQPARIVFRSEPDAAYPGTVLRIGREVDPETREFVVDVRVEQLPPNWAIGQRAEVAIQTGRRQGVPTVAAGFLVWREGRPGVLVPRDGVARWRPVELGLRGAERVEIMAGLEEGQTILMPPPGAGAPPDRLEGRKVALK